MKNIFCPFAIVICTLGLASGVGKAQAQPQNAVEAIENAISEGNDLLARVLVRQLAGQSKTYEQWLKVRTLLYERPQIGFDYLTKWDRIRPLKGPPATVEQKINQALSKADELQLQEKFDQAFKAYQAVAKRLKKEMASGSASQRFLYWTTVHSMARSLYGAGRHQESLEVYDWIPPDYYKFRQVQFEKMWAAFRAQRYDRSLGAIASQQSSYFSQWLEPETYLVQLYLFKKLCRDEDHKKALANVQKIVRRLESSSNSYQLADWAKSDTETKILHQLAYQPVPTGVHRQAMLREQNSIQKALEARFQSEIKRLRTQFTTVVAYSRLTVALDKEIIVTDVVPDRSALMRGRKEFWPVEDAEDWIDELGQHIYIGASQCKSSRKN